jgi:DNA-binding GntR family transcriptional regulator
MTRVKSFQAVRPDGRVRVKPQGQPPAAGTRVTSAEHSGLSDQARARLEEMIVSLELPPGSVWSEADLSAKLGIGRTPVREALQRLEGDHLVRILQRHGAQITEINVV